MSPSDLTLSAFKSELAKLGFLYVSAAPARMSERFAPFDCVDMALTKSNRISYRDSLDKLRRFVALRRDARRQQEHRDQERRTMAARMAPSAMVAPRAGLDGDAAVEQLADDMRLASQREGGVTQDDLELLGWTPAQIETLARKALRHAQSLSGATA